MDHNEMDDIVYEEIDDGFEANSQPSIDNEANYVQPVSNPALGYGRRPQDSFAKDRLGNKGLNQDKDLGKNKNNRNNPSNDAAKNLATGNRKNNQPNKKNPNQNQKDKNNSKNGNEKNDKSAAGGNGHSLGKNEHTKNEESTSKKSGLSSLKSKLGGKGKSEKSSSPAEQGIKSLWKKIPLGIRIKILLIGGAIAGLFLLFLILLTVFITSQNSPTQPR